MHRIECYNKIKTKEYLELLFDKDELCFNDIYKALGEEKGDNPDYSVINSDILTLMKHYSFFPQTRGDDLSFVLNMIYAGGIIKIFMV